MLKKIIQFLRPLIILSARAYWFVFRPHTMGVKIILRHGDEMLLVYPTYGYKPTLPGGGLKKNEKPEDGIRREVHEELGIRLDKMQYLGSFISTAEYKKDEVFAFAADMPTKEVHIDNLEIAKAVWFSRGAMPELGPVTQQIFSMLL